MESAVVYTCLGHPLAFSRLTHKWLLFSKLLEMCSVVLMRVFWIGFLLQQAECLCSFWVLGRKAPSASTPPHWQIFWPHSSLHSIFIMTNRSSSSNTNECVAQGVYIYYSIALSTEISMHVWFWTCPPFFMHFISRVICAVLPLPEALPLVFCDY